MLFPLLGASTLVKTVREAEEVKAVNDDEENARCAHRGTRISTATHYCWKNCLDYLLLLLFRLYDYCCRRRSQ